MRTPVDQLSCRISCPVGTSRRVDVREQGLGWDVLPVRGIQLEACPTVFFWKLVRKAYAASWNPTESPIEVEGRHVHWAVGLRGARPSEVAPWRPKAKSRGPKGVLFNSSFAWGSLGPNKTKLSFEWHSGPQLRGVVSCPRTWWPARLSLGDVEESLPRPLGGERRPSFSMPLKRHWRSRRQWCQGVWPPAMMLITAWRARTNSSR